MKRRFFLLPGVLLLCSYAWAQNLIRGTVTAADGHPIEGVTVSVKGSKIATVTNNSGVFTLAAPSGSGTLAVSSVGYIPTEQPITGDNLTIVLQKDERRL